MNNLTLHTGMLEIVKRLPQSRSGNPRYLARVDGYMFATAVDSLHGYSLPNYEGKRVIVTIGQHYGRVTLDSIHRV